MGLVKRKLGQRTRCTVPVGSLRLLAAALAPLGNLRLLIAAFVTLVALIRAASYTMLAA